MVAIFQKQRHSRVWGLCVVLQLSPIQCNGPELLRYQIIQWTTRAQLAGESNPVVRRLLLPYVWLM